MTIQPDNALVGALETFLHAYRVKYARPATRGVRSDAPLRSEVGELAVALATHKAQQEAPKHGDTMWEDGIYWRFNRHLNRNGSWIAVPRDEEPKRENAPADPVKGGRGLGESGATDSVSRAIHDLWFVAQHITHSTLSDDDKAKGRAQLERAEAEILRLAALASHTAKPSGDSKCFECGDELHAPFCPACNPEMVAPAETVGIPALPRLPDPVCTSPDRPAEAVNIAAGEDKAWLVRLVERQRESGHCGESTSERMDRDRRDDRIDRVLALLNTSPVAPAPVVDREEIARIIDPWAFDGATSPWPNEGVPTDGAPYRKDRIEAANREYVARKAQHQKRALETADRVLALLDKGGAA